MDTRRFPPALQPGDPVGVIAPASPARTPDELEAGLQQLAAMGYQVERFFDSDASRGYLSAPDADRLTALNRCLAHPDLRAIFCVRGGYGSLRLLQQIDYDAARRHPKLLVGYSDITALQWALYAQAGWTSLSGLVVTEWGQTDASAEQHFRTWAEGGYSETLARLDDDPLRPRSDGEAEGRLLGGNLSVLTRLLGTPYCPDLQNTILYLEDVDEAPYAIDRMLAHLQLAGVLDRLAGAVFGTFSTPDEASDRPTLTLDEVVADYFADQPYPVATNLQYGHHLPRLTMPQGTRARLKVRSDHASLTPLEPITQVPPEPRK